MIKIRSVFDKFLAGFRQLVARLLKHNDYLESSKNSEIANESAYSEFLNAENRSSQVITKTLDKIDSFLIHDFNFNLIKEESDDFIEGESIQPFLLPMIIEISNPSWEPNIPDYKEFYRSEYMVGCYGSIESIKALNEDPDVISVESADVG